MTSVSHHAVSPSSASLPIIRAMPTYLVLVRHGESEANLIHRAIKRGELSEYPEGFQDIPDREIRLSSLGREQARHTGPWLAANYPEGFSRIYVSDHTRAKETAAIVCISAGWHQAPIRIDPLLSERSWGRFAYLNPDQRAEIMAAKRRDPLNTPMPDGETMRETRMRSRTLLERAAREFSGQRVLVFSHGEYIEALWAEIAHMSTEYQRAFFESPEGDIRNCQIVEFSSVDPETGEAGKRLMWVRSSCPHEELSSPWNPIPRHVFTPEEILSQVAQYPELNFGGD